MKRAAVAVRARVEAVQEWVEHTLLWTIWQRLLDDEFLDRSVALAAKGFVSAFPAIIVVASFMPPSVRDSILSTVTHRLGVSGDKTVRDAMATSDDVRKTTGILGLIFTFYYVNSFVTALQRVYQRAWRRPPPRVVRRYATGAAWLAALMAYCALLGGFRVVVGGAPIVAFAPIAALATIAVWTLTPWLMLEQHVRFRVLLPTGILTGIGLAVYGGTASIWMPRTVSQNRAQFGFFGVALALVTWLTGAATIIVIGANTGAVLSEDRGWIGRFIRGGDDAPALSERAPDRVAPAD
jgi:uncharacterized BrkB/YihY/UPF0761 family membrane protein